MDKDLFMNPYGEVVSKNQTIVMKKIPRQTPRGVDAVKLEKDAADRGRAMQAMFIIQLLISFVLKGSIDYLFSFFLTL